MTISNCLFTPTSENPRGFSVLFIFTNLRTQTTQLTKHNHIFNQHKNQNS